MKNFKRFEATYDAQVKQANVLRSFSTNKIKDYFVSDWFAARNAALGLIDTTLKNLREWLKENFPRTTADAYHSDQFSFPEFFEMLKKHPELAEDNKEALKALLSSLKASDLTPARITKVPDISEFVK